LCQAFHGTDELRAFQFEWPVAAEDRGIEPLRLQAAVHRFAGELSTHTESVLRSCTRMDGFYSRFQCCAESSPEKYMGLSRFGNRCPASCSDCGGARAKPCRPCRDSVPFSSGFPSTYVLGYFMSSLSGCGRGLLTGTGNSRFLTEPSALFGMTGRRDAPVIRRLGRRVRRVGARLRGRGNRSWGLGRQGGGTGN
jgi:hypothetical protein